MKFLFSLLPILFSVLSASAQDNYYIRFTDKNNNRFSIAHPEAYLSPRSIERRMAQHISINETDLPLTDSYVNAINSLADRVIYRLKWDNAILVRSSDPSFAAKASQLPFVKSVAMISGAGPSTVQKKLDQGKTKNLTATPLDTGFYGVASNQNVMIGINALHQLGYWGDGVLISQMDAGFINVPTDSFFAQTFAHDRILYTWNYVFDTSYVYSYDAHGAETFSDMAANIPGQMVGTAPNAQFLLFVTEDVRSEKIIEEYNWINAAEVADSLGAQVFSTSLGYTTFDAVDSMYNTTYAELNGDSAPMTKAANLAAAKGILVINSAGNDGASAWHYISVPADGDSVVAVGAVNGGGIIGTFSGWGANSAGVLKPNVCAEGQGASIVQTNGVTYTGANGTSFSCPIMAGAFACLREAFPSANCRSIINAVQMTGNYASDPNDDYGYGIPDFGMAYQILKVQYPDDTLATTQSLVYPNPFSSSFNVVISGLLNDPVRIELYDLLGRPVMNATYAVGTYDQNKIQITPPYIADGTYILRINNTYTFRLTKKP